MEKLCDFDFISYRIDLVKRTNSFYRSCVENIPLTPIALGGIIEHGLRVTHTEGNYFLTESLRFQREKFKLTSCTRKGESPGKVWPRYIRQFRFEFTNIMRIMQHLPSRSRDCYNCDFNKHAQSLTQIYWRKRLTFLDLRCIYISC